MPALSQAEGDAARRARRARARATTYSTASCS
jgi:hypothetical protein